MFLVRMWVTLDIIPQCVFPMSLCNLSSNIIGHKELYFICSIQNGGMIMTSGISKNPLFLENPLLWVQAQLTLCLTCNSALCSVFLFDAICFEGQRMLLLFLTLLIALIVCISVCAWIFNPRKIVDLWIRLDSLRQKEEKQSEPESIDSH